MKKIHLLGLLVLFCLLTACEDDEDLTAPTAPILVAPNNASTGVSRDATFNWNPVSKASHYNFQLATSESFTDVSLNEENITAISFSVNDLLPNTQYFWRVNANNSAGTSNWSEVRSFTTASLDVPELIEPEDDAILHEKSATLKWSAVTDADAYDVQVSTEIDFSTVLFNIENAAGTEYTISDLDWRMTYHWRVRARMNSCTSAWSTVWSFTTKAPIPKTNLVAYYPFTGNANDLSGNSHHGTTSGAVLAADRFGVADQAFIFDGVDDFISVPHATSLNLMGDYTISAWFKSDGCETPCGAPGYHTIIMKRDVATGPGDDWPWGLSLSYVGTDQFKKVFSSRRTSNALEYTVPASTFALNEWQHVVVTVTDMHQRVYLNGTMIGEGDYTVDQTANEKDMLIGWSRRPDMEQFKGQLDDIRLYSRAVTDEEVLALYYE